MTAHLTPATKMVLDRNYSHIRRGWRATKTECLNEGVTLSGTEKLPGCLHAINEGSQKPLGHLVRIDQPLAEVSVVLRDHRVLEATHLEHPDLLVWLRKEKVAEFRQQP